MPNINVIIGNGQPLDTLSKDIKKWKISKGKLAAHFIFFNRISYYSGYTSDENFRIMQNRRYDTEFADIAEQIYKLELPDDPILYDLSAGLIIPIVSKEKNISAAQAIIEKMEDGFDSVPEENWVCHPEVLRTHAAALNRHPFAPTINMEFLDGLICPPDSTRIEDVLSFREQRAAEREAFFYELYKSCESIEIDGKKLSVNVDIKRIELAIKNLNRSASEKQIDGFKRSFQFEIRPNEATVAALFAAYSSLATGSNSASIIAAALWGTISFGVSLTPKMQDKDDFTKAIGFVLLGKSKFEK